MSGDGTRRWFNPKTRGARSGKGEASACPGLDEFLLWIEEPVLGREHTRDCATCRDMLAEALRQCDEWNQPLEWVPAQQAVALPRRVLAAVRSARLAAEAKQAARSLQLLVLNAMNWVDAQLTLPAPALVPALRGAPARRTRSVPVVEGDLAIAALDGEGRRVGGLAARLRGPYGEADGHRPAARVRTRRLRANRRGVFLVRRLAPGRYVLEARDEKREFLVTTARPPALP